MEDIYTIKSVVCSSCLDAPFRDQVQRFKPSEVSDRCKRCGEKFGIRVRIPNIVLSWF